MPERKLCEKNTPTQKLNRDSNGLNKVLPVKQKIKPTQMNKKANTKN
jgi:hypothetical protein